MKRILSLAIIIIALASCKKKEDNVSRVVTNVSYPVVSFAGATVAGDQDVVENYYLEPILMNQTAFVTYPVGANVDITPTAYDSVLGQAIPVQVIRDGHLNTSVPGLYVYDLKTGTNSNGYGTKVRVFIGITNYGGATDLSGLYRGVIGSSPDTLDEIAVDPVAESMYLVSDPTADRSQIGAVFLQTSDTTVDFGTQPTDLGAQSYGDITGADEKLHMSASDTTISYRLINDVINASYPPSTRFYLIK